MNRIIIIGNGFDLAHGLKTSFYDFIGDYLQSVVRKVGENKCYKDDLIEISLTQYNSFSNQETKIINVNIEDRKSLIEFFCKRILGNVNLKVLSYEHGDIEKEDTYKISELFTTLCSKAHLYGLVYYLLTYAYYSVLVNYYSIAQKRCSMPPKHYKMAPKRHIVRESGAEWLGSATK